MNTVEILMGQCEMYMIWSKNLEALGRADRAEWAKIQAVRCLKLAKAYREFQLSTGVVG